MPPPNSVSPPSLVPGITMTWPVVRSVLPASTPKLPWFVTVPDSTFVPDRLRTAPIVSGSNPMPMSRTARFSGTVMPPWSERTVPAPAMAPVFAAPSALLFRRLIVPCVRFTMPPNVLFPASAAEVPNKQGVRRSLSVCRENAQRQTRATSGEK